MTPSPDYDVLEKLISTEEVARVHGHANFGATSPRDVIGDGIRKYAVGYEAGYTQLQILLEHGLITTPRPGSYAANLTKKGKKYARALYQIDKAKARAGEAAVEALERADCQFARLAELAAKPEVQTNENGLALSFIFGMERACRDWKTYRKRAQGDL